MYEDNAYPGYFVEEYEGLFQAWSRVENNLRLTKKACPLLRPFLLFVHINTNITRVNGQFCSVSSLHTIKIYIYFNTNLLFPLNCCILRQTISVWRTRP